MRPLHVSLGAGVLGGRIVFISRLDTCLYATSTDATRMLGPRRSHALAPAASETKPAYFGRVCYITDLRAQTICCTQFHG